MIPVIGLAGAAKSGKSTIANYLSRYGYSRHRLAGPLKDMLRVLGLTDAQLDGEEKEIPCELLCGKTPRHAMQTLGTEWRDMIGQELWTKVAEQRLRPSRALGIRFVLDDIRFRHEIDLVERLGGKVFLVRRAAAEDQCNFSHASERLWPELIGAYVEIDNNGPPAATEAALLRLIEW